MAARVCWKSWGDSTEPLIHIPLPCKPTPRWPPRKFLSSTLWHSAWDPWASSYCSSSHLTPAFVTIPSVAQVDAPCWRTLQDAPWETGVGSSWWPGQAAWHAERCSMPRHPSPCSPICPPVPICWVLPQTASALGLTLTFRFAFLQAQRELGPGAGLSRAATTPRATQTRTRFRIPCS